MKTYPQCLFAQVVSILAELLPISIRKTHLIIHHSRYDYFSHFHSVDHHGGSKKPGKSLPKYTNELFQVKKKSSNKYRLIKLFFLQLAEIISQDIRHLVQLILLHVKITPVWGKCCQAFPG